MYLVIIKEFTNILIPVLILIISTLSFLANFELTIDILFYNSIS